MIAYDEEYIYRVTNRTTRFDQTEQYRWLIEQFGKPFGTEKVWKLTDDGYAFKNKEHRDWFLLRFA